MQEPIEVITLEEMTEAATEKERPRDKTAQGELVGEKDYLLYAQLFVCLFLAAVLYFTWRQGGELWRELSYSLKHVFENGISFSGQDELTRFTDEVRDFFGNIVTAFAPRS